MQDAEIIVIRHGETEWNIQGRWQGHMNSPLTENGISQAKAVAKALLPFSTTALYSSDLGRTMQTAQPIAETTGHTIIKEPALRERHLGIFQGLTIQQMKAAHPEAYQQLFGNDTDYCVPEGESVQQRFDRSIACFNQIAEKHTGESVVIVTHGGVLDGIFRYVTGLPLAAARNFKIWNCSLNIFSYHNHSWSLHSFGDISHLRTIQTLDDE